MTVFDLEGWKAYRAAKGVEWPDTYLHVRECRSGLEWICPIRGNELLSLEKLVDKWIKTEYCGELKRDGDIMPKLDGAYYARIMTDGRAPDSVVCWTGGGFYLKGVEQ